MSFDGSGILDAGKAGNNSIFKGLKKGLSLASLVIVRFYFTLFLIMALLLPALGCAYRAGYGERALPGGYDQLDIPIFENQSQYVGLEAYFTNALIRQFERSRVARVTSGQNSPVTLEGVVKSIDIERGGLVSGGSSSEIKDLPSDAVLATEYRLQVFTELRLRRNSDRQILWVGAFRKEGVYLAPRVGSAGLNSANANYNQSAREQRVEQLAQDMMEEAHDRITENF